MIKSDEYLIEVTTPLFCGGADQKNTPADLRPPSIRGAMRFWFRAMMGSVVPDLESLQRTEALLFGNTEARSPLMIRVSPQGIPQRSNKGSKIFSGRFPGLTYLSCQSLFNFHGKLLRPAILPGARFRISLSLRHSRASVEMKTIVRDTFWLLTVFGGIGARTRRCFGGFRLMDTDREQVSAEMLEKRIKTIRENFTSFAAQVVKGVSPPSGQPAFSCFFPEYYSLQVIDQRQGEWKQILEWCGKKVRDFRATLPHGSGYYNMTTDYKNVVQKFIDTDKHGQFRGGAPGRKLENMIFGLPYAITSVHTRKNRSGEVFWGNQGEAAAANRRSSPLFIRPVKLRNNHWSVIFLLFKATFLPETAILQLKAGGRPYRRNGRKLDPWQNSKKPQPLTLTLPDDYQVLENFMDSLNNGAGHDH
jgi:CRISPR-associated protein Cmr1